MKAIEKYFHVVLFIMLFKVVLTFKSGYKLWCVTIQVKTTEHHLYVLLHGSAAAFIFA